MTIKHKNYSKYLPFALIIGVLGSGFIIYAATRQTHSLPAPSPTPSVVIGTIASPNSNETGDAAKSQISAKRLATPTTPSPVASSSRNNSSGSSPVVFKDFSITASNQTAYVSSEITGVSSGTCSLVLVSPTGIQRSVNGIISTSGTYFFCQMEPLGSLTQPGNWSGSLTVTSNGLTSRAASTTFQVAP